MAWRRCNQTKMRRLGGAEGKARRGSTGIASPDKNLVLRRQDRRVRSTHTLLPSILDARFQKRCLLAPQIEQRLLNAGLKDIRRQAK